MSSIKCQKQLCQIWRALVVHKKKKKKSAQPRLTGYVVDIFSKKTIYHNKSNTVEYPFALYVRRLPLICLELIISFVRNPVVCIITFDTEADEVASRHHFLGFSCRIVAESMNPLEILPLEVFLQVLDSVDDIRDKASARSVSKDWKAVVSSTSAWEPIFDAYSKYSRLPHPIMNTLHIFKQLDLIYGLWGRELAPYFVPMWISRYERLHCDERLHNTKPFRFGPCTGLGF
jgi:hypothetical protein